MKRKFKHSTTGYIAKSEGSNPYSYIVRMNNRIITLPAQLVEDPGFGWIEQKDYEILKFTGWRGQEGFKIYSVKRSDGEVFSMEDEVRHKAIDAWRGKIRKFTELTGTIAVMFGEEISAALENIQKDRKPILTTEDGVELFEGDDHWYIKKDDTTMRIGGVVRVNPFDPRNHLLYFSTREAAEEYRLNHARVLSYQDALANCHFLNKTSLTKLVKSRLK